MKVSIKVKPNSKENTVEKLADNEFVVKVKSPPTEGKANNELIRILSEYFDAPKTHIVILKGFKSRQKIVEIK